MITKVEGFIPKGKGQRTLEKFLGKPTPSLLFQSLINLLTEIQKSSSSKRTPNNIYIGQMKISKFTKINKQIIFNPAKQTLIMTLKFFILLSN